MNFSDVTEGAYYAGAVRWAASLGIVTGARHDTVLPGKEFQRLCQEGPVVIYSRDQFRSAIDGEGEHHIIRRSLGSLQNKFIVPLKTDGQIPRSVLLQRPGAGDGKEKESRHHI